MNDPFLSLTSRLGSQSVGQLADAYEAVMLTVALGGTDRAPDRRARLAILDAMLAEGRRGGFDAERLAGAGIAAARPT